jgi:hypothetical protein
VKLEKIMSNKKTARKAFLLTFFISILFFVIDILNGHRPYRDEDYSCTRDSSGVASCPTELYDITDLTPLGKILISITVSTLLAFIMWIIAKIIIWIKKKYKTQR